MAFTPRYYQKGAVDALFNYWMSSTTAGNPLIDLATGAGKSPVMGMIIQDLLMGWPDLRIMVVTHVRELIEQNYQELVDMWPAAGAGIFSASVGRRDARSRVIFAGIQTVWNKADLICQAYMDGDTKRYRSKIDVVLIDECHMIPPDSETQYGKFFAAMREINPEMKIVGLTATPYRLDFGRLDEGEDRMFDEIVYTYSIAQGVEDGYLTPLTSKATETEYGDDMFKGVRKGKDGDLSPGGAAKAVAKADHLVDKIVDEIIRKGQDRRSWMLFCSGIEHADKVRDAMRRRGISCETISGDMDKNERRRILEAYKRYEIRCLTNNGVLTTGFNHPGVDLIGFLRKTLSLSLYLQMAGRGTRVIWPAGFNPHDPSHTAEDRRAAIARGPKPNCLVLDFARLVDEHGPVDMVKPKGPPGSGNGEAPSKLCDPERLDFPREDPTRMPKYGCNEKVHASARKCKACGYEFAIKEGPDLDETAADIPIMGKGGGADWRPVWRRSLDYNEGKGGKPDTIKVTYKVAGGGFIMDWLSPAAPQVWLKQSFREFWKEHGGGKPMPRTAYEVLERQDELLPTDAILVTPGKNNYWKVKGYKVKADDPFDELEATGETQDEIPF